jgi:divalent metal cation (Fe/Co/Zn/Cd) transporter
MRSSGSRPGSGGRSDRLPCTTGNPNGVDHWESLEQRRRLEVFVVGYKSLEGSVSIIAGILAGSVALSGFGITSLIQGMSGMAFLLELRRDLTDFQRDRVQRLAPRAVGVCLVALGLLIACGSVSMLVRRQAAGKSISGIIIPFISLDVLSLVSKRKRLDGRSVGADSTQDDSLAYLPAILLGGLLMNAVFGLWWTDPGAALVMAPIILRQGVQAFARKGSQPTDS